MSERIDHAAEAHRCIEGLHDYQSEEGATDESLLTVAIEAQTHATLALVEQQRIANLIAALTLTPSKLADETIKTDASEITRTRVALRNAIRAEVREGLGL